MPDKITTMAPPTTDGENTIGKTTRKPQISKKRHGKKRLI